MANLFPGGTAGQTSVERLVGAVGLLEDVPFLVRSEASDAEAVGILMGRVRRLQRVVDGIVGALGEVAEGHASAGTGATVEQVLSTNGTTARGTVAADAGRARLMGLFAEVGSAIRAGTALPSNVDCLARHLHKVTDAEGNALVGFDGPLAERISSAPAGTFRKYVQRLINSIRRDHGANAAERDVAAATGSVSPRKDRTGHVLRAEWETERGTAVFTAVRNERRELGKRLGTGHGLTNDQLMAQAIHDIIVRGSAVNPETGTNRAVVVVNVLTDAQTLAAGPHAATIAETFDGQPLAPLVVGRLCCDSVLRKLDAAPDGQVNGTRTVRTATSTQRAALRSLYPVCPLSGEPWSRLEIHHVIPFEHCRETQIGNLVPISTRIHHLVHEGGWKLTMDPDRTLRLDRPDGTLDQIIPPPIPINHLSPTEVPAAA